MTDVVGPPLPPERFSSPAIRGRAAATGGTDDSGLKVNCNMARRSKFQGKPECDRGKSRAMSRCPSHPESSPHAFQIAAPDGPTHLAESIARIWVRLRSAASAQMPVKCH